MWKDLSRIATAAGCWATAIMTMVMATVEPHWLVLAGWGLLFAIGGSVFIVWHLLVQERLRVMNIAKLLDARDTQAIDGLRGL